MSSSKLLAIIPTSLSSFPQYLSYHIHNASNPYSLFEYYRNASDPVHTLMPLFWTSMTLTYLLGLVTGNVSQIDRQWTFLPLAYSLHFVLYPLFNVNGAPFIHNLPRLVLMYSLMIVWGIRLTSHTYRRGLYNFSDEDYRWQIWRDRLPVWLFQLFHLGFIAIIQSVLLLSMSLPYHHVLLHPSRSSSTSTSTTITWTQDLGLPDLLLTALTLLDLFMQWHADNQQYHFHSYKSHLQLAKRNEGNNPSALPTPVPSAVERYSIPPFDFPHTPEDAERGFLTKGLWGWSRHPNFACEMGFWGVQGLWPVLCFGAGAGAGTKGGLGIGHPLGPALAYSCLFIASTWFTESITSSKYPKYKSYQALTGQFSPIVTVVKCWMARTFGTWDRLAAEAGWVEGKGKGGKED